MYGCTDGRTNIPCILQDIAPLGPLPKRQAAGRHTCRLALWIMGWFNKIQKAEIFVLSPEVLIRNDCANSFRFIFPVRKGDKFIYPNVPLWYGFFSKNTHPRLLFLFLFLTQPTSNLSSSSFICLFLFCELPPLPFFLNIPSSPVQSLLRPTLSFLLSSLSISPLRHFNGIPLRQASKRAPLPGFNQNN